MGSVDVSKFVKHRDTPFFDWVHYRVVCSDATRALNNIVDVGSWPTEEISEWVDNNKPIGLGVMGFADACLALGYRYGDNDSIRFAADLISTMYDEAEKVSVALGNERGVPESCKHLPVPRRNVTLLSIAPTGTLSLIAGCSSGCEPVFQYVQIRKDNTGSYVIVHPEIKRSICVDDLVFPVGTDYAVLRKAAESLVAQAKTHMSDIMVTANDISVNDHILIQSAFQVGYNDGRCVDSGVSKTVNMPNNATVDDVAQAYETAYKLGCKGITIYRDGSKYTQVLNSVKEETKAPIETTSDYGIVPAKRFKMTHRGERWYVIIGENNKGEPKEVFTFTQNTDDTLPTTDAVARMISLALRYNVPTDKIVSQLRKVRQYSVGSFPAMIARVLSQYVKTTEENTGDIVCTQCASKNIEFVGGCPCCKDCGYSKCG